MSTWLAESWGIRWSCAALAVAFAAPAAWGAACVGATGTGLQVRVDYPLFEPEDRKLLVTINGPAAREAVVEDGQALTFTAIPAGRYTISMLRPGFRLEGGGLEVSQQVADGQCELVTLRMAGAQRISGVLYDSHAKPLSGVQVKLERAADRLYATTDQQGRFAFRQVTPGPYWLATGSDGFAEQYYPVVADQDEASVIYVLPGEDVENVKFYIPQEAHRRRLTVRVVRDDGSPANGAQVTLRPARGEDRKGVEGAADAQGRVEFLGYAESAYEVIATAGQGLAGRLTGIVEIPAGAASVEQTVRLQQASPRTAGR